MDKKIKWGVIGSGGIARRRTIPEGMAVARNAALVAVYDIDAQVNRQVAGQFGAVAAGSIGELLAADIDAVYVASPVNMHYGHVLSAAAAGKHILCEKSLAMDPAQAQQMITACKEHGVTLGIGLMMRFTAQHEAARKMVQNGLLGTPVFGRAQLSCWYPPIAGAWRQSPEHGGGGSLVDMGSHCIDLLEMFFGPVQSVHCFVNNTVHPYPSEDSAICSLKFRNGALGSVDTFFCIPDNSSKNVLELYGSRGSIIAQGTIGQGEAGRMTAFIEADSAGYDAGQNRDSADGMPISPPPVNPYRAEIEEFSAAIIEGRQPVNDASVGLHSQMVIAACYESARTGKAVEL